MSASRHPLCPVCESPAPEPFAELRDVPVHCNVLWPTRAEALAADLGDVVLHLCTACGMVWNAAFDADRVRYVVGYENSLHFSAVFRTHARALARRLVDRYDLHGKDIVEVGSGKGEFLVLLCALGGNRGVGFDPSYDGEADGAVGGSVRFVRDLYSEAYADISADFVLSRHVLEHVDRPREFVGALRRTLGDRREAVVYLEVPAAEFVIGAASLWDVIYEHPSIFSAPALRRLVEGAGFRVLDIGFSFGGQYLWVEAAPGETVAWSAPDPTRLEELAAAAGRFGQRLSASVARWRRELDERRARGPLAVWGAGSKGVTFVNLAGGDAVSTLVDVNPRKRGRHVPGAGHAVTGPDGLRDQAPATILVMNGLYAEEIRRLLEREGVEAELVVV
jgi:SAM-dependent methyltransferase